MKKHISVIAIIFIIAQIVMAIINPVFILTDIKYFILISIINMTLTVYGITILIGFERSFHLLKTDSDTIEYGKTYFIYINNVYYKVVITNSYDMIKISVKRIGKSLSKPFYFFGKRYAYITNVNKFKSSDVYSIIERMTTKLPSETIF